EDATCRSASSRPSTAAPAYPWTAPSPGSSTCSAATAWPPPTTPGCSTSSPPAPCAPRTSSTASWACTRPRRCSPPWTRRPAPGWWSWTRAGTELLPGPRRSPFNPTFLGSGGLQSRETSGWKRNGPVPTPTGRRSRSRGRCRGRGGERPAQGGVERFGDALVGDGLGEQARVQLLAAAAAAEEPVHDLRRRPPPLSRLPPEAFEAAQRALRRDHR